MVRRSGVIQAAVCGADDVRVETGLDVIGHGKPFDGQKSRRVVQFNLASLERTDSSYYLEAVGFRPTVSNGQAVFVLRDGRQTFYIPTAVILQGLVRMTQRLAHVLLSPVGRDTFWRPILLDDNTVGIEAKSGLLITGLRRTAQQDDRLIWFSCYPSARRAWDSVYAHALDGRLDIDLPSAEVTATLTGLNKRRVQCVTWMTVRTLRPLEKPTLFSPQLKNKTFIFDLTHRQIPKGQGRKVHRLDTLPKGPLGWRLTDQEWEAVREVMDGFHTSGPRTFARGTLEDVLEKFGEGKSFKAYPARVSKYYRQLRITGKWPRIESKLRHIRRESRANAASEAAQLCDRASHLG